MGLKLSVFQYQVRFDNALVEIVESVIIYSYQKKTKKKFTDNIKWKFLYGI